ncbi:transposase (fragment) [Vibrio coralliirubri]|uniref:Transposase n=1 Tax=Vibrio coralliirubri TaxID=1516159 RepID=A0AA86XRP4_9VIBR
MKRKRQFQPHDAFFKQFMTHPETAKDLLDIHLPVELREICDLTTFKLESGSFIEENLRPYYSDVIYSLNTSQGDGYVTCFISIETRGYTYDDCRAVTPIR